ncbi:hypothetical protein [Bradyrhizobium sp. 604_D8_N2_3]|uniref:hypothetical protein n=1 Tax=Bradyrhizobium sp. 604_D8_N2_3 TaxID=3240370 RepID=UPI003F247B8F
MPPTIIADRILIALRRAPDGLSRSAVSAALCRNARASELRAAFAVLTERGVVTVERGTPGPKGGRPVEIWRAAIPAELRKNLQPEPALDE